MFSVFADLITIIAPVILCAGVGIGWTKLGQPFDSDFVTRLISQVTTPCLIVSSLTGIEVEQRVLGEVAGIAALNVLFLSLVGWGLLRLTKQPATAFLPPLVFGNHGNIGLPLCLFAFGEPGLALGIAFFTTVAVIHFTLGFSMASGRWSLSHLLRAPMVHAALIGTVLMLTETALPAWLGNSVELMGQMSIPLMLLALGVSLGKLQPGNLPRTASLAALRLGLGMASGWLLVLALDIEGLARSIILIQTATPAAVLNYLFASQFHRRAEEVAGVIVLSTLMAFVLLPIVLYLAGAGASGGGGLGGGLGGG